jgi:ABC-type nickel/cobalt efflux system permease component RcnA
MQMSLRSPRLIGALMACLLAAIILAQAGAAWAQQNPLMGASAPAASDNAAPADDGATAARSNAGDEAAPESEGLLHRIEGFIIKTQRDVNREINRRLVAVRDGHGVGVVWAGLSIAFLYGVFHALGPGHGKTVIVGYFLGRGGSIGRGMAMAGWIAVSHVIGAIVIVLVAHIILSRSYVTPVEEVTWLRFVSYAAILAIGLVMLVSAIRGRGAHAHCHHHGDDDGQAHHHEHGATAKAAARTGAIRRAEQRLLAVAAGFIPCSGAILILVFAFTNGIVLMGVLMALAIAVGMGLTLAALGIASVVAHHQVTARIADGGGASLVLSLLGPALITLIGLLLLSGAILDPGAGF